ncbi:MAG TPA: GAF domain-containing protein [Pseudogracilibacillus sp.]|nr:GAF domain-containing protein [Pseudogracilibacillus sp.]
MFQQTLYTGERTEQYEQVIQQLAALLEGETNQIANLSNASALLNQFLERINWVGFYLLEHDELVLGPFQGLPACIRIPMGQGVCGTAAEKRTSVVVKDVNTFSGHIACDPQSQSEVVIPMIKDGKLLGVLDIDSPETDRFDELDKTYLEKFVTALLSFL